jgi:hypothetical protein
VFLGVLAWLAGSLAMAQQSSGGGNQKAPPPNPTTIEPVTGKTAEHAAAINVTTTGSVGQTTPGADTQAGVQQRKGENPPPVVHGPMAPPNMSMAGQSEEDAEMNAEAASRAEISPGGRNRGGLMGEAQQNLPALGTQEPSQRPPLANKESAAVKAKRRRSTGKPVKPAATKASQ